MRDSWGERQFQASAQGRWVRSANPLLPPSVTNAHWTMAGWRRRKFDYDIEAAGPWRQMAIRSDAPRVCPSQYRQVDMCGLRQREHGLWAWTESVPGRGRKRREVGAAASWETLAQHLASALAGPAKEETLSMHECRQVVRADGNGRSRPRLRCCF